MILGNAWDTARSQAGLPGWWGPGGGWCQAGDSSPTPLTSLGAVWGVCCLQHSPSPVTCLAAMAGKGTVGQMGLRSRLASSVSSPCAGMQSPCFTLPSRLTVTPGASRAESSKELSCRGMGLGSCGDARGGGWSCLLPAVASPWGSRQLPSSGPWLRLPAPWGRAGSLVSVPGSSTSTWGLIQRSGRLLEPRLGTPRTVPDPSRFAPMLRRGLSDRIDTRLVQKGGVSGGTRLLTTTALLPSTSPWEVHGGHCPCSGCPRGSARLGGGQRAGGLAGQSGAGQVRGGFSSGRRGAMAALSGSSSGQDGPGTGRTVLVLVTWPGHRVCVGGAPASSAVGGSCLPCWHGACTLETCPGGSKGRPGVGWGHQGARWR